MSGRVSEKFHCPHCVRDFGRFGNLFNHVSVCHAADQADQLEKKACLF